MRKETRLTDEKTWETYWGNKELDSLKVQKDLLFHELFERIYEINRFSSFIEIGGYPGTYSVFFKKYFEIERIAFIDFVNDHEIFNKILKANNLEKNSIEVIEQDLFKNNISEKFDLVFSNGFIEHFTDTREVLLKHKELLSNNGCVLVTLPNFRGFNGWIQKQFDRKNYSIHNLNCMDIKFLERELNHLKFKNIEVFYYGKFSIWLENFNEKGKLFKIGFKLVWFLGKVLSKILPFQSKLFSPYICIIGQNEE